MEIPIKPKLYSFHEAFNALGRELFPDWTGKEINAQKCHAPEDVDSVETLPGRLKRVINGMGNPSDLDDEGLQDLQNHIDGANHARLVRQFAPWAREIEDLENDPKAYQARYDLWFRYDETYERLIEILHDGYAASWLETPEGDTHEIQRTHWGGANGPFTPNLPGDCGEYKGAWGEAWGAVLIDKESLDRFLGTPGSLPAAGPGQREARKEEKRREYKTWSEAAKAFKKKNPELSKYQVLVRTAKKMKPQINENTFRKMVTKHHPDWAQ